MPLASHLPSIDDRRFEDLLEEARARVPRYTPEWTDLNDNDVGVTLIQLLAWLTEMQLYRLNQVPELNYLKFLELLGIELLPARPASTAVTFPLSLRATGTYTIVPQRTQVSAEATDSPQPIVFETERALYALKARLAGVQAYDGFAFEDVTLANRSGTTGFEPFGSVPVEDSQLLIGFDADEALPAVELALTVFAEPQELAQGLTCHALTRSAHPSATIVWEYWGGSEWLSLSLRSDSTQAFSRSGSILLMLPESGRIQPVAIGEVSDALYWIRARIRRASYERAPNLLAVRTNTVTALQAETIEGEVLGGSDGSPNQRFRLANAPVLEDTLVLEIDEGSGPEVWTPVADFYGSGPDDRSYVLSRTTGEIRFGDGRRGAIPVGNIANPTGSIVAKVYRFGGGIRGNVAAGALTTLTATLEGVDEGGVTNLLAATGGRDEESLAEAKLRAPRQIRSRCRAVTPEDFEELAKLGANIARAKALPLAHPKFPGVEVPGVVTVIVVPEGDKPNPTPSEGTLRNVCEYLNQARLLTTELYVVPPTYRTVHIRADVVAEDAADLAQVKKSIEQSLLSYFHPLKGGEDGHGWPFGGDIYFSRVYQRIFVAGVQSVGDVLISVDGNEAPLCSNITVCPGALVYSTEHDIRVVYGTAS